MHFNLLILPILLLFMQNCYANSVECPSNKIDNQCSGYCYQVVKPLLQHAVKVQQKELKFDKLSEKIREQEATINSLKLDNNRLTGIANELAIYKSNNVTQSELLSLYKAEIDKLSAENNKINKLITTPRNEATNNVIIENNQSNCLIHKTGIHDIQVHSVKNFRIPCDSKLAGDNDGWTVIQRRKDAAVSFDRNWIDYRTGFGDIEGSFFIGLEKLHLLTNEQPHELYIYLKTENETRYARYDHFQIGDDNDSFKIKSIGKYSGTAGDSLSHHINMKFSTFDADHDTSKLNCGSEWLSGWWFLNCAYANLNGLYRDDVINYQNGIKWHAWADKLRFTFVQMMIKPVK